MNTVKNDDNAIIGILRNAFQYKSKYTSIREQRRAICVHISLAKISKTERIMLKVFICETGLKNISFYPLFSFKCNFKNNINSNYLILLLNTQELFISGCLYIVDS